MVPSIATLTMEEKKAISVCAFLGARRKSSPKLPIKPPFMIHWPEVAHMSNS